MTRARDLADSADKDISGTLTVDDLTASGDVTIAGDLTVSGTTSGGGSGGTHTGDVVGNVTGNLTGDVTGDVTGNVTGNLTGNVTGDVTGNTTGTHTGAVTGNVTGNLTGDVTGNVTGNVTGDVTGSVTATAMTVSGAFASQGIDDNATSTSMTLDASGTVMVGKASAGFANVGTELSQAGFAFFTKDSSAPVQINRKTNEGHLVETYKDGTAVGTLGVNATRFLAQSNGGSGLRFDGGGYTPFLNGSAADNTVDLGFASGRYKDLYLGGGVYLGGTGSANKISEYETGTWSPSVTTGTVSGSNNWYIKIGRQVTVNGYFSSFSDTSSSNSLIIGGLPYTSTTSSHSAVGSMIAAGFNDDYYPYLSSNATTVYFYNQNSATYYQALLHSALSSGASFYFTLTYQSAS